MGVSNALDPAEVLMAPTGCGSQTMESSSTDCKTNELFAEKMEIIVV
jgi:hypothetical protein